MQLGSTTHIDESLILLSNWYSTKDVSILVDLLHHEFTEEKDRRGRDEAVSCRRLAAGLDPVY
jgi:hypothetical protein